MEGGKRASHLRRVIIFHSLRSAIGFQSCFFFTADERTPAFIDFAAEPLAYIGHYDTDKLNDG